MDVKPDPFGSWRDRLEDPQEPLYTVGVVADLLGLDSQTLRRLDAALSRTSARPSGNQRRYSRRDIETLADAVRLSSEGNATGAIARIQALERRIAELTEGSSE